MLVLRCSSTYSPHINHSGQDSLTKICFLELQYYLIRSVQNADCRSGKKCRLGTKCRLQTGYKMQTENSYRFFRLGRDNVSPYHLPSVTQSLFRDHLSRLFALLWNIPCPFLDHNIFFSLWVGWCDVCTEFTNLLKVDVDVNEMYLRNRNNRQLCTCPYVSSF